MSLQKYRIFSPRLEKTYFLFLSIFIILFIIHVSGMFSLAKFNKDLLLFVVCFIFMNTGHTFLTVIMLCFLPEFKAWLHEKTRSKWLIPTIGIFCLIGIGAYLSASRIKPNYDGLAFFLVILALFDGTHIISQIKGLSLMYNRTIQSTLSEDEKARYLKIEKRERFLFDAFILLIVTHLILLLVFNVQKRNLISLYTISAVTLVALIIINSLSYPKIENSNKRLYLLSGVFTAFSLYSAMALLIQRALHGIEYCFLSYDVVGRSSIKMTSHTFIAISGILVLLFLVSIPSAKFPIPEDALPPAIRFPVIFFAFFLRFFHYYMDSQMFRFRDPTVRTHLIRAIIPQSLSHDSKEESHVLVNQWVQHAK